MALTPNFPSKIVPVDLKTLDKGKVIARPGVYMSHVGNVALNVIFDWCICTAMCGGLGCARQHITGDGTVFLNAGGTVMTKTLAVGESIMVDTDSVVGFEQSVSISVRLAGGCFMMCCGGEGYFNTMLTGPGLVVLQSMSFNKYRAAVQPPQQGNGGGGEDGGEGGGSD